MIDAAPPPPLFRRLVSLVAHMTTAPFAAVLPFSRLVLKGSRSEPVVLDDWKCTGCTPRRLLGKHALQDGIVQIVCRCNAKNTLMGVDLLARMEQGQHPPVQLVTETCPGCGRIAFEHAGVVGKLDVKCLRCPGRTVLVGRHPAENVTVR
jgi:hypothetical protein